MLRNHRVLRDNGLYIEVEVDGVKTERKCILRRATFAGVGIAALEPTDISPELLSGETLIYASDGTMRITTDTVAEQQPSDETVEVF